MVRCHGGLGTEPTGASNALNLRIPAILLICFCSVLFVWLVLFACFCFLFCFVLFGLVWFGLVWFISDVVQLNDIVIYRQLAMAKQRSRFQDEI